MCGERWSPPAQSSLQLFPQLSVWSRPCLLTPGLLCKYNIIKIRNIYTLYNSVSSIQKILQFWRLKKFLNGQFWCVNLVMMLAVLGVLNVIILSHSVLWHFPRSEHLLQVSMLCKYSNRRGAKRRCRSRCGTCQPDSETGLKSEVEAIEATWSSKATPKSGPGDKLFSSLKKQASSDKWPMTDAQFKDVLGYMLPIWWISTQVMEMSFMSRIFMTQRRGDEQIV